MKNEKLTEETFFNKDIFIELMSFVLFINDELNTLKDEKTEINNEMRDIKKTIVNLQMDNELIEEFIQNNFEKEI